MAITSYNWLLVDLDNQPTSSGDRHWSELSSLREVNGRHYWLTDEPAAQLSSVVGGRQYTVKAPDRTSRFYIEVCSRTPLFQTDQRANDYLALGYVCEQGRFWIEIDERGHATCRFEDTHAA